MMKYLICFSFFVLLVSTCVQRETELNRDLREQLKSTVSLNVSIDTDGMTKRLPYESPINSPASLLKKNADGSMLVKIKPHVYTNEMGCTIVMDEMGNTFAQLHYVIDFYIEAKYYYTIWGVLFGERPPINLNREKEYRFLVRPYREEDFKDESVPCEIIKIWDGEGVIFEIEEVQSKDETRNK